jgi:hypothetical protein
MSTSKTPRANRRTSQATTPSRAGQRPATRSTAQTPKQSNLGTRFFDLDEDDASEVPDLLEEGGTTTAASLSFDTTGESPTSAPSVASVVPKPAWNRIQPQQEVHLQETPATRDKNSQGQAVPKTRTRGRARSATPRLETRGGARSATPRPDSGKAQQLQLTRKTRSSKKERSHSPLKAASTPAANSVPSHPDAAKTQHHAAQKGADTSDRSASPPKASPAATAKPSTAPQPDASKTQHRAAQKKGRRQKAPTVATATTVVVPQPSTDKNQKTRGRGRSKAPAALSGNDQDRSGAIPGSSEAREESNRSRGGPAPSPKVRFEGQLANETQLQASHATLASKNGTPPAASSATRQLSSGDGSDGKPAPVENFVSLSGSNGNKLRLFQEKLARKEGTSEELSVQQVVESFAKIMNQKQLRAELGKENRGYLLTKLSFDAGDALSRDLATLRRSEELKQLIVRSKKALADENEPDAEQKIRADYVAFVMDVLEVVSTNEYALRMFAGFVVRAIYARFTTKDKCLELLINLGVADGEEIREGVAVQESYEPLKFLTAHLLLNSLFGSNIGSSTVNFYICVMTIAKSEDLGKKSGEMGWPFREGVADRVPGWNRVPGCDVDERGRLCAPTSSEDWRLAIVAAREYTKSMKKNNGINDAIDNVVSRASPEETHEHFSALAKSLGRECTEHVAWQLRKLMKKGTSFLDSVLDSNLPEQGPWRAEFAQLIGTITDVADGRDSSGEPAAEFSNEPPEVIRFYPIALGFTTHSRTFLESAEKYISGPFGLDHLGVNALRALELAVSEAKRLAVSEAEYNEPKRRDGKFSGRLISLGSLNITKVLGSGKYGTVFLGASREGPQHQLAVKLEVIEKEDLVHYCYRSLLCQSLVESPNVSRLLSYDSFTVPPQFPHRATRNSRFWDKTDDDSGKHVCTVLFMELGGKTLRAELDERSKRDDLDKETVVHQTLQDGVQIASGLVALHDANLLHRDVKPENLVRGHHGELQIVDLGLCRVIDLESVETLAAGTMGYIPPEIDCEKKGFADVYALGVILHEVRNARAVFYASEDFLARSHSLSCAVNLRQPA